MAGFVDEAQIHVKGGNGGAGAVSFRREAHVPRGGPDGGDGGSGGDVWLVASTRVASLLAFRDRPHRRGGDGQHGAGRGRHGPAGSDLVVEVPVGTVVRSKLEAEPLADLGSEGESWRAAQGGRGGHGNARFLSNARRAPGFAEQGELGEERWLDLEIKLVADVALVGLPNAGKSTLISRVSAARPKIADYPFTTLEPHLGVVRLPGDGGELIMADVPGLIEGASEGKGLGHRFLRHVERARVLLVLVDLASPEGRSPEEQERILVHELGRHRSDLLERPRLVVGSRADLAPQGDREGLPSRRISAVTGQGITGLLWDLVGLVATARTAPAPQAATVVHRPMGEAFEVVRAGGGAWEVRGRMVERAVALNDLNDPGALDVLHIRLRRLGVERALRRAGVRPGDEVTIGGFSFSWQEDAGDPATHR